MQIIDVALNIPVAKPFSYLVPDAIMQKNIVGRRAEVNFARRRLTGFIVALRGAPPEDLPEGAELQPILRFVDKEPVCTGETLELAHWLSSYYLCSLGQALAAMIPSGRRGKLVQNTHSPAQRAPGVSSPPPDHTESSGIRLTEGQAAAVREITAALHADSGRRFLLHGVTGSGKTEVYRRAARAAVDAGRQVVLLVPEISLTPQMIERFAAAFPGQIAALHSGLTPAERIGEWRRIASGEARVVIGARSAVFAPVGRALFIIDEEHVSSYKADDCPRYHARQVAFKRTAGRGTLVLGSATPSLETLWHAQKGSLTRIPLDERIAAHGEQEIEIVDMRGEAAGALISARVIGAIREAAARGEQSLLFINRRGYAPFVSCNDCAKAVSCPQCSVSLALHRERAILLCHTCGYSIPFANACPTCQGKNIRTGGAGTERIAEFLAKRLPGLRVGRLDSDLAASSRGMVFKILEDFSEQRIDALVGTQMIAKGHDFPNLTVVAVVAADNELSLPDFRSYERVYNQILQVVGRAGRAEKKGFAFIQTSLPFEDPIRSIAGRDDGGFARREIGRRRECLWPPFSRLVRIVMRASDPDTVSAAIQALGERLRAANADGVTILGPVACPIEKKANYWRQHILLKGPALAPISALLRREGLAEGGRGKVYIEIDVDPQSML